MNSEAHLIERPPDAAEYNWLRRECGLAAVDETTTRSALNNSLYCVSVYEDGRIVGCGRLIGDGGLYYYIHDILVHPEHRTGNVTNSVISQILAHLRQSASPEAFVALTTSAGEILQVIPETSELRTLQHAVKCRVQDLSHAC